MFGAIFGDIAGSVYEFNNIKTTKFDLLGEGTTFTDDSVLTIAVAYWLLDGTLTNERLAFTLSYFVKKYPNPMGSYGVRFLQWANGDISRPYNSWGNGSAMRVAPVGWAFNTLEETEKIAAISAEVTHNHPEGIKGAQATAAAIFMARNLATKNEIKSYIEQKYGYNLSRTCDEIRPTYQFIESCQETVPQAIIAFLDSRDFESAIRLAVSLGGDSDTLACITGGIAEAFYGMTFSIPESVNSGENVNMYFRDKVMQKLPNDLSLIVKEFDDKIIMKNKRFWAKNDSATVTREINWIKEDVEDKVLDEESYKSFLLGYGPDWDMRYGVYYEDGWCYIYRSHCLLKKFRFKKQNDGLYHVSDFYDSNKIEEHYVLEDILMHGYFQKPFRYKNRHV